MKTLIGIFVFMILGCTAFSCHAETSSADIGVLRLAISTHSDEQVPKVMNKDIKKLTSIFSEIVDNCNNFGRSWRNLKLGQDAFAEMTVNLPLRVKGELTPYTRIVLLNKMLECIPQRDCPRFILKVREYQESMFPLISEEDVAEDMDIDGFTGDAKDYRHCFTKDDLIELKQKTIDYLNPAMSMEEWCRKYDCHLLFDDIERSAEWEAEIYDVEKEVARKMRGVKFRMGYCFEYWSTKKSVLARHGIDWRSPSSMNPTVMFD